MKITKHINAITRNNLLVLPFLVIALATQAQSWTNHFDGPAGADDYAKAVALDRNGNVAIFGSTGGGDRPSQYATIMYSGTGRPLWTNVFDRPAGVGAHPAGVVLDHGGNVIVNGYTFSPGGDSDFATVKYSPTGVPIWTNYYGHVDNGHDSTIRQKCLAVDSEDSVFVAGDSQGIARDWYNSSVAIVKYSSTGLPLWTNRFNALPSGLHTFMGLAVDSKGDAIAAGYAYDQDSRERHFVIKYSGAGTPLWTNYLSKARPDAVAVDAGDNVFVASLAFRDTGPFTAVDDVLAVKYSAAGTVLWTNLIQHTAGTRADSIALVVDAGGSALVCTESIGLVKLSPAGGLEWRNGSAGTIAVDGTGNVVVAGVPLTDSSRTYAATIKYTGTGVPLWTNLFGGSLSPLKTVAADANGDAVWAGSLWNGDGYDWVTVKYGTEVGPQALTIHPLGTNVVVSWTDAAFSLQSGPSISGAFTSVPGATSPYTNALSGEPRFFRLAK